MKIIINIHIDKLIESVQVNSTEELEDIQNQLIETLGKCTEVLSKISKK